MQGISAGILIAADGCRCRETAKAATSKAIRKLLLRGAMMRGEVERIFFSLRFVCYVKAVGEAARRRSNL